MNKTIYEKNYKIFLNMLREYRVSRNITQVDLSKLLKTQQTTVSKMERGERKIDFLDFWNICTSMNIDAGKFIKEFEKRINKK
jgi:transcriptional regulator with XRE-family HTH domain